MVLGGPKSSLPIPMRKQWRRWARVFTVVHGRIKLSGHKLKKEKFKPYLMKSFFTIRKIKQVDQRLLSLHPQKFTSRNLEILEQPSSTSQLTLLRVFYYWPPEVIRLTHTKIMARVHTKNKQTNKTKKKPYGDCKNSKALKYTTYNSQQHWKNFKGC